MQLSIYYNVTMINEFNLLVATPCILGESPRWDEKTNHIYWVDIDGMVLHSLNLETNTHDSRKFDEPIGCVVLDQHSGLVVALKSGIYTMTGMHAEPRLIVQSPEIHLEHNRFNDGRCDKSGRFIVGTVYPPKDRGGANLYSLTDKKRKLTLLQDNLMTSNGVAFNLDNTCMYLADTPRHVVYRYSYDNISGAISNKKVFIKFPKGKGRPDGASVDSENCYWSALYAGGRVVRINPEGKIIKTIKTPCKSPTMIAFGGSDYKTLYMTAVGEDGLSGLYSCQVEVAGTAEKRYLKE